MRTWEKIACVLEELAKLDKFTINDLLRIIEYKLQIGEGTAKNYLKMMFRHELLVILPDGMVTLNVKKEEKEEKNAQV